MCPIKRKRLSNPFARCLLFAGWLLLIANSGAALAWQNEPVDTQEEYIEPLSADQSAEKFELPDGFDISVFASEPDVRQPIAATFDARGRLWVVECLTYSDSSTNYDLSLNDQVIILEDTDNDGRFDNRTVFWDEGKKLTGIEVGMGGVWLTGAPDLLFIPDRNRDDVPDGEPEVILTGFEGDVIRHNIVNGLRWGPDGWLYGRHGIQATSFVGPPGSNVRTAMNCCVWRIHPVHRKFELVAQGGTNPWGFDYDQYGEMFISNTVIGHLFHIVPGARYRRMYGAHFNAHTYQVIEQTADHFHWDVEGGERHSETKHDRISAGTDAAGGGHAHVGLLIYQGDNWPAEYHNSLMMGNFHGRRINVDHIHREGNSYIATHGNDILKSDDAYFRCIELLCGPDGGVYILDWYDIGECHENDGIHRTSGRIFKVAHGNMQALESSGLDESLYEKSDEELVSLLGHKNQWFVRKARRLLQERAVENSLTNTAALSNRLMDILFGEPEEFDTLLRLRALWTAYSCDLVSESELLSATGDPDEHVRAWAVRLLSDGLRDISESSISQMAELAASEDSGLVRLYLAAAIGRLEFADRFELATALCSHAMDASDRTQPHLIWFGIEPAVNAMPELAVRLAAESRIPLIRENIVRRLVCELESAPEPVEAITRWLIEEPETSSQTEAMRGFSLGLEGWSSASPPANWTDLDAELRAEESSELSGYLQNINLVFGDGRTLEQLKQLITDNSAPVEARRRAIRSWAATSPDDLFDILRPLARNKALTTAVVEALVKSDRAQVADVIINRFPHMDPDGQSIAISTLASRTAWTTRLLDAIQSGVIPRDRVTAWHAGLMFNHGDDDINSRLEEVWGKVRATPQEKLALISELTERLFEEGGITPSEVVNEADVSAGRLVFEQNCAACHTLFGTGGTTGPDLTGADRFNANYLLTNIVDPGASVAEDFRASIIVLVDGRTITGLVLETTDRIIRVQTPTEVISLDRDEIEAMRRTELSVMPEAILDNMDQRQIADLFKYLLSPQQVPLPAISGEN
ncbi:MAG: PVC-type heme-binding CxxCH protein [Planctomycetota bacterium]